jgi:hypothetical protein
MKKPLIVLFAVVTQGVHGAPSPYQAPHAPATQSAYLTLPAGAVEPQGWLRDWCEQIRDGFTGRMEDVNPAFKQAWAADYRITGPNLYWGKGGWPYEGGGYWFEGLAGMAAQLKDECLIALANRRFDAVVTHMPIVCPPDAPTKVKLAAKEIRRYVYLRTGSMPPIIDHGKGLALSVDPSLDAQAYRISPDDIAGGSDLGVLYGAYRYAELLGVRFYLHGDVVPDERLKTLPAVNETGKPLFDLRGVNPWGSHPFGFDAWGTDDYKAIIAQLAKMRMNFIGMHCYPEGHPYAEPTVWHGLSGDFDASGQVDKSYVSRYYNTLSTTAWGAYVPKKTGDYSFGAALLFDDEAWAPEVMRGHCPVPVTPNDCNEVFNRMGAQFKETFTFARNLGVKTCIGTEAPLILPKNLAQRTSDLRAVYEGTFRRIMASHPLDYYWLWTPEGWTWQGNKPEQYAATVADIQLAMEALANVKAPFKLATSGWVLGPQHDRATFDRDLPKTISMSAISREIGNTPVDPAFGKISGRETWAIPWLEGDGGNGLAGIQLWAGRMRRDALDAREYGCTGLMGLHWRTEILSPNASALALAAWDQNWGNPPSATGKPRSLPVEDFYADFALANFGLAEAGKVFAALDGKVPQVTDGACPSGTLTPVTAPWKDAAPRFAFVDTFECLRPRVRGAGNLARFDYWLNTFNYLRALEKTRCAMGAKQPDAVLKNWTEAYTCLLATVNSPGALATVVNMENHPGWGGTVARHTTQPWPKDYQGRPRLIVPTVRSVVNQGESLEVKVIALAQQPVKAVMVHFRPLGMGDWQVRPARQVARAVFLAELPAAQGDFEYTLTAGDGLVWPATAPAMNQTVVVAEKLLETKP